MSQVVITKDKFTEKRLSSLQQEREIKKDDFSLGWRISDVSKTTTAERVILVVLLPFAALWTMLSVIITVAFGFLAQCFKIVSGIWNLLRGSK